MRRAGTFFTYSELKQAKFLLPVVAALMLSACAFQNKNKFNRAMQNLTAHYNILFNANELLRRKQEAYALAFIDNYGDLLNVYQDTIATQKNAGIDKDLDAAITKANNIISEKDQSKYIGDAYEVLGKANFLNKNYFNSAELFNYVIHTYPENTSLVQEAEAWKIRSLLYQHDLKNAKLVSDTALRNINLKKDNVAGIYAARLQYDNIVQEYGEGEEMAKNAIKYAPNKTQRMRWTFILGQLQELNHETQAAIASYNSIANSNVVFEMAFNAQLNTIRIQDQLNGVKVSRTDRLLSLLKNPNNKDFTDQIYFQVAEIYALDNDLNNALKYYKMSVRASVRNQNQKGLAYLRIADINFKYKADYVTAKKYYDSTLTNLAPTFPGYQAIQIKNNNLKLLSDRLFIIGHEDTLQRLAKMDEKTRNAEIDAMVSDMILQQRANATALQLAQQAANNSPLQNAIGSVPNGSNFYFYNANAVSQGMADFKRKWGGRKLQDNWRISAITQSSNSAVSNANTQSFATQLNDPDAVPGSAGRQRPNASAGAYRQKILNELPLTASQVTESNTRIYGAYLDIANFYRDLLNDKKEAIANFLALLTRFPNDPNKANIYYNLYRLYSETDQAKSEDFKNRILKEYPESAYAHVILDPDYAQHAGDKDVAFNLAYNKVYDAYAQRKYAQTIGDIDVLAQQESKNPFVAQLFYLRALAAGHQEGLEPFQADLQKIATDYPTDALITPLVKQHLTYIAANREQLSQQQFALMDNDTTGVRFIPPIVYKKETAFNRGREIPQVVQTPVEKKELVDESKKTQQIIAEKTKPAPIANPPTAVTTSPVTNQTTASLKPKPVTSIFSHADSTNYYFVLNVATVSVDMAPTRFGVGQFNRTHYPPNAISHQLKAVGDENQLIYVGRFYSLEDVKKYARGIVPLLPEIMKVPKEKYSFFIITQENLNKLVDKKTLDSYFDYYQQTY